MTNTLAESANILFAGRGVLAATGIGLTVTFP
jgi:hypothetical protein